jgi:pectate lyase
MLPFRQGVGRTLVLLGCGAVSCLSALDERELENGTNQEAGQSGAGESGAGGHGGKGGSGGGAGTTGGKGGTAGASVTAGSGGEAGDAAGGTDSGTGGTGGTSGTSGTSGGCPAEFAECEGVCLPVTSDNANCGECGNVCTPGSRCEAGECACITAGTTLCSEGCTDTLSDAAHCGACDRPCETGEVCVEGTCECPGTTDACGGACVDTASDAAHCGACAMACDEGTVCSMSSCSSGCGPGLTQCGQSCVDVTSSAAHCGACDEPCDPGQTCESSACTCPNGQLSCDGECLNSDSQNCGSCGNECTGGRSCTAEGCACPSGGQFCDGQCRNVMNDAAHCGTCGTTCGSGICNNGACAPVEPLVGYAGVAGLGRATTTGGGTAGVVRPANAAELRSYASDATARVIELTGVFDVPNLAVASHKTLIGTPGATINGGISIVGTSASFVQNVIVRNISINAATAERSDGIDISYAHHVWIDHVAIWDAADGNLDIIRGSDYITISWCKFWYSSSPPDDDHRFANLIGNSDSNEAEDRDALKITFHHNWWAERVAERMPRLRFGDVHIFNNLYTSAGNTNGIGVGIGGATLIENNVFKDIRNPHYFVSPEDEATAYITVRGNLYTNVTGTQAAGGGGAAISVPYAFVADPASNVEARVRAGAGPRVQ